MLGYITMHNPDIGIRKSWTYMQYFYRWNFCETKKKYIKMVQIRRKRQQKIMPKKDLNRYTHTPHRKKKLQRMA